MRGRGGGQRLFGTFPKIHLFWKGKASLREETEKDEMGERGKGEKGKEGKEEN